MLLNTEELLALVNGDAEPDRLADLLDRLEHCPESAEALQVLVSLRANREEALEVLRTAADHDVTSLPMPYPTARRSMPSMSWALQGLRMAAAVALVAVVSVWAAQYFTAPVEVTPATQTVDITALATNEYINGAIPRGPVGAELTSSGTGQAIAEAYDALKRREYAAAKRILELVPSDAEALVPLYRGMSLYFLRDYEGALAAFHEVARIDPADSLVVHHAAWYEANTLLALNQPSNAMNVLEKVTMAPDGYWFRDQAAERIGELRVALGWTTPLRGPQ